MNAKLKWLNKVSEKWADVTGNLKMPGFPKSGEKKVSTARPASKVAGKAKVGKAPVVGYLSVTLVFLGLMAGTYYTVAVQDAHDKEFISLVAEQRLLALQISQHAGLAAAGDPHAFANLSRAQAKFSSNMTQLEMGNPETGMPGTPVAALGELGFVTAGWNGTEKSVDLILDRMKPITSLRDDVQSFNQVAGGLLAQSDELISTMVENGATNEQIYVATRQLMLIERISKNMNQTLEGGDGAVTAADAFGRDSSLYSRVLNGLTRGSKRLSISAVADSESQDILAELTENFRGQMGLVGGILENSIDFFQVRDAAATVSVTTAALQDHTNVLLTAYTAAADANFLTSTVANIFGLIGLLTLFMMGRRMMQETKARAAEAQTREDEAKESNRDNQDAILRLLDEIGDLADGDLSVSATVSEDFTGAIADSINFAIDSMRRIVTSINKTTVQVASAAQNTRQTALDLTTASKTQAEQIVQANGAATNMVASFEHMSSSASDSEKVAQHSVDIANKGAEAVQDTIAGMDSIREHIQETSKRIKRLGESSQEIGEIVGLIDDIADQTNILALNAAIQASMAGEAGRGFAVVADEVQRLAERSSNATKQIESLVKTIQGDTNEAVASMEKSTQGVVAGAQLAQGAGEALIEIKSVSGELSGLIHDISSSAGEQAVAARDISDTMSQIQGITSATTKGTQQTATSIGELFELANELRTSVAGFKLPQGNATVAEERISFDETVPFGKAAN